jgi:uncharacterized phage protein (TIGR02216 family)
MNEGEYSSAPEPFPWGQAMRIGFGRLRLSSRDFWALTPRELAAAIEGIFGETQRPTERTAFEALMRRFPDGTS